MNATPTFDHLSSAAADFDEPFNLQLSYLSAADAIRPPADMNATACSPAYSAAMTFDGPALYPPAPLPEGGGFGAGGGLHNPAELDGADKVPAESFVCDECSRQFLRSCDLNKHAKTHTRPFKCPVPGCKFSSLGWPTEKELERHHNDVHSSRPLTFTCLYQPCPYTSKRESNLKQHMEKTHGWNYVRSRSSRSYKCPAPGCAGCFSPDDTRQRHGTPAAASVRTTPLHAFQDFELYPDPEPAPLSAPPADFDDGTEGLWESYVPWASPPSRGQDLSKFLQSIQSIIKEPSPLPLDPQLARPRYIPAAPAPAAYAAQRPGHLSVQQALAAAPLKTSCSPPAYALATPGEEWSTAGNYTTSRGPGSNNTPAGGASNPGVGGSNPAVTPITPQSARRTRPPPRDSDGDSESDADSDEEPPQKKARHMPDDDFDEKKMPCPFFLADPDFFNREKQEKFSPCHTKHKEVSTIVRHLGRPAHQLHTDSRSVHSFDRPEMVDERPRPKAGICKTCWRIFRDRAEFDSHVAGSCGKVSRGKREKFFQLYTAFCTDGEPGDGGPLRSRAHAASPAPPALDVDMEDSDDEGTEPPEGGRGEDPVREEGEAVTAGEHRHLVERVQAVEGTCEELRGTCQELRDTCQKLWEEKQALLKSNKTLEEQLARMARFIQTRARPNPNPEPPTSAFFASIHVGRPAAAAGGSDEAPRDARDTASLVGGMNSAPFVLDRGGLMDELVRDTARRTGTGLSSGSDRSSVRHVPHSPRFPSPKDGRDGGGKPQAPRPAAARTSTDSGYAGSSTKGKASVAAPGAEGADAAPPTPTPAPAAPDAPRARFDEPDPDDIYQPAGVEPFDTLWPPDEGS